MPTRAEKYARFVELHRQPGVFIIPNPWDAGSARLLTSLGFEALATTSAGLAFTLGERDSAAVLSRETVLTNAAAIVDATRLPVSADLEAGFGASPDACADTIRLAAATGLVGGSIEDATGDPRAPIFDLGLATERIAAAAEAARGCGFVLTARAENFLWARPDLDNTLRRLEAFAAAGADVLYAPGLPDLEAIRTVCAAVKKPVNVVMGLRGPAFTVEELAEAGVKRISVGGSLARAALGEFLRAATELREQGTFSYASRAISHGDARRFTSPENGQ